MSDSLIDIYNAKDIDKKVLQILAGICAGIVADNKLSKEEFDFLRLWIEQNAEYLEEWPGSLIRRKIDSIIEDGVITEVELNHFRDVLKEMLGFDFYETGSVDGSSTSLPVDKEAAISFPGKTFCYTGQFIYGTRNLCHDATTSRGGEPFDNVKKGLDYLVIGGLASKSWVNTSYGRKIQKAIDLQEKGQAIFIIDEQMWCEALN